MRPKSYTRIARCHNPGQKSQAVATLSTRDEGVQPDGRLTNLEILQSFATVMECRNNFEFRVGS